MAGCWTPIAKQMLALRAATFSRHNMELMSMEARKKGRDRRYCRPTPQMNRGARSGNLNAPKAKHYERSKVSTMASRVKLCHRGTCYA